mgnify:CR=1 FL=1
MEIEINGTVYSLKFGIGLIKELNKKYHYDKNGLSLGVGMQQALSGVFSGDVETLIDLITLANKTEMPRLARAELENAIDDGELDIEKVFDDVQAAIKESNATKFSAKKFLEQMEKEEKKQE